MATPFDTDPSVRWGVAEVVAPGVRRVTAANPGAMTFSGTRSYLVGRHHVALIDPGPDDPAHAAALLGALAPGERVAAILVTHSHRDHSAGAARLAAETGAPVLAYGAHGAGVSPAMQALASAEPGLGGGEGGDEGFTPDARLADGEAVDGPGWRLRALHTPGHLSNHLCFALEGTGVVFTGDTVMGWASTLVSPPEGDMGALMQSLRRLAGRAGDRLYLPGHGHAIADPAGLLAHQIAHREARAATLLALLRSGGAMTVPELVRAAYRDVDRGLWPAAERNVLATLIALSGEGRVLAPDGFGRDARFALP